MDESKKGHDLALCFLHGLDSSPKGTKAIFIRDRYPQCLIPCLPRGIEERLEEAEKVIKIPSMLIGTSLGGLTAVQYAMKRAEMVRGLVLMAPAVGASMEGIFSDEEKEMLSCLSIPPGIPCVIIAGLRDEVIPIDSIHDFIQRSPGRELISLHLVDDDHDLHNNLDLMLEVIEELSAGMDQYAV